MPQDVERLKKLSIAHLVIEACQPDIGGARLAVAVWAAALVIGHLGACLAHALSRRGAEAVPR